MNYKFEAYSRYNSWKGQHHPSREIYYLHLINTTFPLERDASILDLGCGSGSLLNTAQKMGYNNLIGVEQLTVPHRESATHEFASLVTQDIIDFLNTNSAFFDFIILFDVLEHFKKEDVFLILSQVFLRLKDNGKVLIHVPNGASPIGLDYFFSDITHETCFTSSSLRQLLICTGFHSIKFVDESPTVHGLLSFIRYSLWKSLKIFLIIRKAIETGSLFDRDSIFGASILAMASKKL